MGKTKILFMFIFSLASCLGHAANSCRALFVTAKPSLSDKLSKQFPKLAASQPQWVPTSQGGLQVYNQKLAELLRMSDTKTFSDKIPQVTRWLYSHGAFEFPLTEEGFLPAANNGGHHGGYGSFVWYRDLARALGGVSALPKLLEKTGAQNANPSQAPSSKRQAFENIRQAPQKMTNAMLGLFAEKEQILRVLRNIADPSFHKDPAEGYRRVPFVRQHLDSRKQGRQPGPADIERESQWGHKQNDALALYAQALLDANLDGLTSLQAWPSHAKTQMILWPVYFQRVGYASMEDVGAWEEGMGLRTSSIGLVTSFLERFQAGWEEGQIGSSKNHQKRDSTGRGSHREKALFQGLKHHFQKDFLQDLQTLAHGKLDGQVLKQIVAEGLKQLPAAIEGSYRLLYRRLGIAVQADGKRVYSDIKELEHGRGADAALLHMLLFPPKGLTIQDRVHVLGQIKKNLMKESGFIRYENDWFLYGNPNAVESAGQLPLDPDMIAVWKDQSYQNSTRADRDRVYQDYQNEKYNKNMDPIIAGNGPGLEAQWSFQDAMMAQIYAKLFRETGNRGFLQEGRFHLDRSLAWVTGENQISIEGAPTPAWRVPEAWIPVRIMDEGSSTAPMVESVATVYFASPNSPLNWATAEIIMALYAYEVLR